MESRSLKFIAQSCAGKILSGSWKSSVLRVSTDSRQVRQGDLFFALSGDNFDGHQFVEEAARKGAVAVVVSESRAPAGLPGCGVIAVADDPRQALGRLAARYRRDFNLPVVAVGGSNGKTTTKELIAAVLRQGLETHWSESSFNNDIGVPLSLLRLEPQHQAAVFEAGTNHPGELEPLIRMIHPVFGVLTCIGREHLEFFGDVAGVAAEEGALAGALPQGGKLFLNGDDEWSQAIAQRTQAIVKRVGFQAGNDWQARALRADRQGITFRVECPRADLAGEYRINLLGRPQAVAALFAIALGAELGLDREQIARGLAECKPATMRLQLWESHGVRVLDDAYNANADSMRVALETLMELPCKGRRIAVLGDMGELGAQSEQAHEEVGRRVAELGVSQLFAVGKMAPLVARSARAAGLSRILEFADAASATTALKQFVKEGDLVLIKASRASRIEQTVNWLRNGQSTRKN